MSRLRPEHSGFDPCVEELTSDSFTELILHLRLIDFVAVMLLYIITIIQIVTTVRSRILLTTILKFQIPPTEKNARRNGFSSVFICFCKRNIPNLIVYILTSTKSAVVISDTSYCQFNHLLFK